MSQGDEKAKAKLSTDLDEIWDLLIWWTSFSFDLVLSRERNLPKWFCPKKTLISAFIWTCADQFLSNDETAAGYYISIPIWITLTFSQGHSCIRNTKFLCLFSCKFVGRFGQGLVCCHNQTIIRSVYNFPPTSYLEYHCKMRGGGAGEEDEKITL